MSGIVSYTAIPSSGNNGLHLRHTSSGGRSVPAREFPSRIHTNGAFPEETDSLLNKCDQLNVEPTFCHNRLHTDRWRQPRMNGSNSNVALDGRDSNQSVDTLAFGQTQKTIANNRNVIKGPIEKKPRPNSLAILSRSHDLLHIRREEEVGATPNYATHSTPYCKDKAASADTLLQTRSGLQDRRNQRPTSLLLPSILDITAQPYLSNEHSSHEPTVRQRSHSVPSAAVHEVSDENMASQSQSLDVAVNLISKKKISKAEIDEQALIHRAADAGHVKLVKKCISAGCQVDKLLSSLNGTSALHCAARADRHSAQITKILLETGMVDVNTKNYLGETALFSAVIHKNMDTVDVLVQHGCDINSVWQASTPLYLMLCSKDLQASTKLIHRGAFITSLSDSIRQPLHAVLDLCHTSRITYETMKLLKLLVQADGNVVEHLHSYVCTKPGSSEQEIIYHIYRMDAGPPQDEGKQLVKSLINLGYVPTRGELSVMNGSTEDYDDIYSYIKTGPAPLKDLCIRVFRQNTSNNVFHTLINHPVGERERMQILLESASSPDNDYENFPVIMRHEGSRRSKHKSIRTIMNGISRLSRRFSKKADSDGHLALSLPPKETKKPKPPIAAKPTSTKPAIKPKPRKFAKKESLKRPSAVMVQDVVSKFSESNKEVETFDEIPEKAVTMAVENPAYVDTETSADREKYVSSIALTDEREDNSHTSADQQLLTTKFHELNTSERPSSLLIDSSTTGSGRVQTPVNNQAPGFSQLYTVGSIRIDES